MSIWDIFSDIDAGNLAADTKWAAIRAFTEGAISEGFNLTDTASSLRELGFRFDDKVFRPLYHELADWRGRFDYQLHIGRDFSPNPENMAASRYSLEGNYGYVGQWQRLNPDTGLLEPRTFRFDSDELLTTNQALDALRVQASKYEDEIDEMIGDIEFIGSMYNSG